METTILSSDLIVQVQDSESVLLSTIQGNIEIQSIVPTEVAITFTDIGAQGFPGAQGPQGPTGPIGAPLTFDALSEVQKLELRGDVGDTSTNYTNIFNSVLLS